MDKKKTKQKILKILKFFFGELLVVRFIIPNWLLILVLMLPFIAYSDFVLVHSQGFFEYLFVCALELLLVFIGFSFANASNSIHTRR